MSNSSKESVDLNVATVIRALGVGVETALMPLNGSSNTTLKNLLVFWPIFMTRDLFFSTLDGSFCKTKLQRSLWIKWHNNTRVLMQTITHKHTRQEKLLHEVSIVPVGSPPPSSSSPRDIWVHVALPLTPLLPAPPLLFWNKVLTICTCIKIDSSMQYWF